MVIRSLIESDYKIVASIYKKGIDTGIATFETIVPSWEVWDKKFLSECRFVIENNNKIIGWCALSKVSDRYVYRGVAEDTIYIDPEYQGKQVGKKLLNYLISESEKNGFWSLYSAIFPQNEASITLHKNCGFRVIGTREKIAILNGKWYDNVLMERRSSLI
jgi:phosphinothricin acetyltransferase